MKNKPRFYALSILIIMAALSRILPHPPNVTPIAALALFGGAYFENKKLSFLVPLLAMVLSDLGLAVIFDYTFFSSMRIVIYACFIAMVFIGFKIRNRVSITNLIGASMGSSILFFVISNFAVWTGGRLYPLTLEGLTTCYVAAIPFFTNTFSGDLFYVLTMFGIFELAQRKIPALKLQTI